MVAVLLDAEVRHRLAGRADAVGDFLRPLLLDADHHYGGQPGVRAASDHPAEVLIQLGAELHAGVDVLVDSSVPAVELLAGVAACDDDHVDAVAFLVHHEVNHSLPVAESRAERLILCGWSAAAASG